MYEVHFRRSHDSKDDYVVSFRGSLPACIAYRRTRGLGGDLVTLNGRVVESPIWLFDWEKADPNCYAQRAIRHDNPSTPRSH